MFLHPKAQKEFYLCSLFIGTGVTVNSLHPGVVDTELPRHIPVVGTSNMFNFLLYPFKYLIFKTSLQGAQTSIRLAVDPSLEKVTGKYFRLVILLMQPVLNLFFVFICFNSCVSHM